MNIDFNSRLTSMNADLNSGFTSLYQVDSIFHILCYLFGLISANIGYNIGYIHWIQFIEQWPSLRFNCDRNTN